jgi:tetratricopeptide (TPR) repeat protein
LILLVVLAASVVAATQAQAQATPSEADLHFDRGLRHYNVQSYGDAIAEFKAAYEIDPRPEFLYALAQAQRMSGDCAAAVVSYQAFLRTAPPARQAAPAQEQLQRCQNALAEKDAPEGPAISSAPSPAQAPPPSLSIAPLTTPATASPPATAEPRRIYQRWWFWTLVGGAVAAGVGIAAAGGAFTRTHDAPCPPGWQCLTP